jgi:hypothetical protein
MAALSGVSVFLDDSAHQQLANVTDCWQPIMPGALQETLFAMINSLPHMLRTSEAAAVWC